jgi:hypothetical protein
MWRRVEGADFASASPFIALTLPLFPAHARSLISEKSVATPFRESLQSIVIAVMSVMSGTFPNTYGVFYMTVNCWCIRGPSCSSSSRNRLRYAVFSAS